MEGNEMVGGAPHRVLYSLGLSEQLMVNSKSLHFVSLLDLKSWFLAVGAWISLRHWEPYWSKVEALYFPLT